MMAAVLRWLTRRRPHAAPKISLRPKSYKRAEGRGGRHLLRERPAGVRSGRRPRIMADRHQCAARWRIDRRSPEVLREQRRSNLPTGVGGEVVGESARRPLMVEISSRRAWIGLAD